jgi:hypothetical protein
VPYFHVVFTLPRPIADIAHQNKAVVYDLLLKVAAETLITIAADPKHLGARIGLTAVLHTWGSALTHHPHAHIIVPRRRLLARQPVLDYLPTWLLSFRSGALTPLPPPFPGKTDRRPPSRAPAVLSRPGRAGWASGLETHLAASRKREWVVSAKRPFGGPEAVLAYLSRYTHRIAIANSRLVAFDGERVTFKWKDYRAKGDARYKLLTLDADEFIRRFLIHVLPDGFHRIRHYGFLANANRAGNIALARRLLGVPDPVPASGESDGAESGQKDEEWNACPCCGARMIIVETFEPGSQPRRRPFPSIGLDSS